MKSLRINRGAAVGVTAASLFFAASTVAIPHAAAEAASKDLALKCTYTAPLVGTKDVETTAKVTVDMPKEVDAGADIPVKVTTGDATISHGAFIAVTKVSAEGSTIRLQVSPNAELVGTPEGVTLNNGVLSVANVLSASKTAMRDVTVTAKPAEFTLRSSDGEKVTVGAASNVIDVKLKASVGEVPTTCQTTATQLNETTITAAPAPEPEPNPEDPAPGDNENPGEGDDQNPGEGDDQTPGEGDNNNENPGGGDPAPSDPKQQGSSTDDFLSFIFKIFGMDKSDEGKQTAITFWSAIIGGGILAVLFSTLAKFTQ